MHTNPAEHGKAILKNQWIKSFRLSFEKVCKERLKMDLKIDILSQANPNDTRIN